MSEKLLPCPFCGGEAELEEIPGSPFTDELCTWGVGCKNCNIGWYKDDKIEAIAAWNRRSGGWISVKERFPEGDPDIPRYSNPHFEFCTVMATGFYAGSGKPSVGLVNRLINHRTGIEYIDRVAKTLDEWYWGGSFERVTHWMSLPEPPEGVGKNVDV